jgi:hypothetical protein
VEKKYCEDGVAESRYELGDRRFSVILNFLKIFYLLRQYQNIFWLNELAE